MRQSQSISTSRTRRWRWALALIGLVFVLLLADGILYPRLARPRGPAPQIDGNGAWLHFSWYAGDRSKAEAVALARRLVKHRIRDAYFHVRSVTPDGRLRFRHARAAQRLVRTMHESAPGARCFAWVYAGNIRGLGSVDLSNRIVRGRMAAEAVWLVTVCGFDGVQWDYEICPDGDADFLALIRETRAALPHGKLLSVATPLWLPHPVGPHGWRAPMFGSVAAVSDQIVVMAYDSGIWLPRAYAGLVSAQVVQVTRAAHLGSPVCEVLIGVPTYDEGGRSHQAYAENLRVALIGVRAGLNDLRSDRGGFTGISIFAEYTTQPEEWALYHRWWVAPRTSEIRPR